MWRTIRSYLKRLSMPLCNMKGCNQHIGGTLEIVSESVNGTRLVFTLPFQKFRPKS